MLPICQAGPDATHLVRQICAERRLVSVTHTDERRNALAQLWQPALPLCYVQHKAHADAKHNDGKWEVQKESSSAPAAA